MKASELTPGCKVDIRIVQLMENQNEVNSSKKAIYYTTLFEVNSEEELELVMPTEGGKLQVLPKGIRYEFVFSMSTGIYKAEGTIVEHLKRGNFYLLKINLSSALKKVQRREYFRMECLIPMMFMGLDEVGASYSTLDEVKGYIDNFPDMKVRGIGTILDISGGGARFVSTNSLQDIPYILMQVTLENEEKHLDLEIVSKMIAKEKMPDDNKYVHRVKFMFKDEHTQEKIISYIFDEERKNRKREQGL